MKKTLIHQKLPGYLQDVFLRLSSLQQLLPLDSSVTRTVDLDEQEEGERCNGLLSGILKKYISSVSILQKNVIGLHFLMHLSLIVAYFRSKFTGLFTALYYK